MTYCQAVTDARKMSKRTDKPTCVFVEMEYGVKEYTACLEEERDTFYFHIRDSQVLWSSVDGPYPIL